MDSVDRLGTRTNPRMEALERVSPGHPVRPTPGQTNGAPATPFQQMLAQELASRAAIGTSSVASPTTPFPLQWSAHAQQRLRAGEIAWGQQQERRLASAVDQLARKGGRQALVLLDDVAFIVSVPHRTVITAIEGQRRVENVFTQIDSAVIAR